MFLQSLYLGVELRLPSQQYSPDPKPSRDLEKLRLLKMSRDMLISRELTMSSNHQLEKYSLGCLIADRP